MKEFKKFCWMAFAFCFMVLFATINVSFAGPLGLFPNFHPLRAAGKGAHAVVYGAAHVAHGAGRAVAGRGRSGRAGCANGACQSPAKSPAQAPQQKK